MAAVGYARVSTLDQDPQRQLDALEAVPCDRIFVDHATGTTRTRPQLRAALEYMRAGDTFVVLSFDRLARSLRDLLDLVSELTDAGIHLRVLNEAIDTSTPQGRLQLHIFGALAEFQVAIIRESTRAGLAAARARGAQPGRPPKLTPAVVAAIGRHADEDISIAESSRLLGLSVSSVSRGRRLAREGSESV